MPKAFLLAFPAVVAAAYSPMASAGAGSGMVPCKPIGGSCAHCTDFDYNMDSIQACIDTSGERQDVFWGMGCFGYRDPGDWNKTDVPLPDKCKNKCVAHGDACVLMYGGLHSPEYCNDAVHEPTCGCDFEPNCHCTTACLSEPDAPPHAAFFLRAFN